MIAYCALRGRCAAVCCWCAALCKINPKSDHPQPPQHTNTSTNTKPTTTTSTAPRHHPLQGPAAAQGLRPQSPRRDAARRALRDAGRRRVKTGSLLSRQLCAVRALCCDFYSSLCVKPKRRMLQQQHRVLPFTNPGGELRRRQGRFNAPPISTHTSTATLPPSFP